MVGMFISVPTISFSKEKADSTILEKMWSYRRNFAIQDNGGTSNTYMRYTLNAERRNFTLFLIPSLYTFAKGDRQYISEIYGRTEIQMPHNFKTKPQIISTTIPHERQVSDAFTDYLTPNIYDMTIYEDKILSPFYRSNRFYYRYRIGNVNANLVHVTFRPKLKNTQLVKGYALVNSSTGRVVYTTYDGEFDMLRFHIDVVLGTENSHSFLPQRCKTDLRFKFLGNTITSHLLASYNAPTTLPDSLNEVNDARLMDTLRVYQLNEEEKDIYLQYDLAREMEEKKEKEKNDKEGHQEDSLSQQSKKNFFTNALLDVGDRLVTSSHTDAFGADLTLSPILNPQYISYSHSRGMSYKIQLGARYAWNRKRYLTIKPQVGYNFKIKQFFHYTPIRMTYNPKRNGYAEIIIANGNRISNSSVLEAIKNQNPSVDVDDFNDMNLDYFTDNYVKAINNVVAYDWLEINTGLVYHVRKAENIAGMREYEQPAVYRSFAPTLTLHVTPWRRGPYFTLNYERSIKGVLSSNLEYERYEFDVSHMFRLNRLRVVNLKGGLGLYTNDNTSYFLDYANFHDENLPGGWEDDWTGNFQLLNSEWYNTSRYYLRAHVSYESPLLVCSFLPWIGKYIETERIYLSMLSIQHTRPYAEIGYGVTTRFISIGAFASMLNASLKDVGLKFTFELFRKW